MSCPKSLSSSHGIFRQLLLRQKQTGKDLEMHLGFGDKCEPDQRFRSADFLVEFLVLRKSNLLLSLSTSGQIHDHQPLSLKQLPDKEAASVKLRHTWKGAGFSLMVN